ncbi:class I SAM-dependent methyltransferase [Candidatus Woesearchaeota archaeon]|nr:class I SAM-dependent methyltransferase [Candidatus Woesearchaeota archaeon]
MEHYYSKEQKSPLDLKKISQRIRGTNFEFCTASGIFSKDRVDKGTLILAENMIVNKNNKVLDIGCGIGILGIAAAKIFNADVAMTDINKRAVMLAKKNAKLNNVNAGIFQGNLYEKTTGNPQTAGKELCFRLIEESKSHLKANGSLQLVARHNKGGASLSKKMEQVFGNVKVIAKKSGYSVYMSNNL